MVWSVYRCGQNRTALRVPVDIPHCATPLEQGALCLFQVGFQRPQPHIGLPKRNTIQAAAMLSLPASPR